MDYCKECGKRVYGYDNEFCSTPCKEKYERKHPFIPKDPIVEQQRIFEKNAITEKATLTCIAADIVFIIVLWLIYC